MPFSRFGPLYQYSLAKELYNEEIKVIFPRRLNKFPFLFPIFRNILQYKIKLLHMHWIDGFSGLSSKNRFKSFFKFFLFKIDIYLAKNILKTKIVWTIHNLHSHMNYYPLLEILSRRSFSKKVDAIICHCAYAKNEIQKIYGVSQKKIHIINIGNYYERYPNEISMEKAREYLNIKQDQFIFLIFGPIRPYKGIINLINAFKKIRRKEKAKLMIVGNPVNKLLIANIINRTKDNQNFILKFGFIPEDEIQLYINASDVVVFSYKKILTSAGILLAMSFGKPIIAPRLGCIPETLDEKGAFLYNSQEKKGLLLAVEEAIDNKSKLKEMGQFNLESAKKFDWKDIAKETNRIYNKISLSYDNK